MKVKYLWVLLPIVVMWLCFYVVGNTVPMPATEWWHLPVVLTSLLIWFSSVILAIDKIRM